MATALSPFLHGDLVVVADSPFLDSDLVVVADMLARLVNGALAPLAADLATCNRTMYAR